MMLTLDLKKQLEEEYGIIISEHLNYILDTLGDE